MFHNAMLIGLGFLTAALIALLIAPRFWRRAVKQTSKRIRARSPLTRGEIQADRDQLRAQYALETRRLEVSLTQLKKQTTEQKVALSVNAGNIGELKAALEEKTRQTSQRDAGLADMSERIEQLENTLQSKEEEIKQAKAAADALSKEHKKDQANGKARHRARVEPVFDHAAGGEIGRTDRSDLARLDNEIVKLSVELSDIMSKETDLEEAKQKILTKNEQNLEAGNASSGNRRNRPMKKAALEALRARLLADLPGLEQKIFRASHKLEKHITAWQSKTSPFKGLEEKLEVLSRDLEQVGGRLAKLETGQAQDGRTVRGDIDAKSEKKPKKSVKAAPKGAADTVSRGSRGGRPATLADRIRALQKEIVR